MTVKEANKRIEQIDNEISNLKRLLRLDEMQSEDIKQTVGLNSTITTMVDTAIITMTAYKNDLREKIDNAKID